MFSGSPFQFTVGPIAGGGAHKVHAAGLGLIRGEVNEPGKCLRELSSCKKNGRLSKYVVYITL